MYRSINKERCKSTWFWVFDVVVVYKYHDLIYTKLQKLHFKTTRIGKEI